MSTHEDPLRKIRLPSGRLAVYYSRDTDPTRIQRYGRFVATLFGEQWWNANPALALPAATYDALPLTENPR